MWRWMLAAMAFGAAVVVGAAAVERWRRLAARQTRGVWAAAMIMALTWPLIALRLFTRPAEAAFAAVGAPITGGVLLTDLDRTASLLNALRLLAQPDTLLAVLWGLTSFVLTAQLVRAVRQLRRVERDALATRLHDEPVLMVDALGPAVFGIWRPRVVVPRWLLDLDEPLQRLVLRHEREHCAGRDPWLVWLAVVSTTLMPWNLALWVLAHRLRLAMEVDCDARTLQAYPDRRAAYARLLLFIAQRATTMRITPALAHVPSHLSRRINAMSNAPTRRPTLQRVGVGVAIAAATAVACSRPVAGNLAGPAPTPASAPAAVSSPAPTTAPAPAPARAAAPKAAVDAATAEAKPFFDFQVEQPATMKSGERGPRYPEALRTAGVEGVVLAQFVVGNDGRVDMSTLKVLKSSHDDFTAAVRESLAEMHFEPARVKGTAVKQLLQQPFMFRLPGGATSTGAVAPSAPASTNTAASTPTTTDREARARADVRGPEYPVSLREQKVEGSVLVQLVVNADGSPDMNTLKVLKSDHALFTDAVKAALVGWRWEPAMVKGTAVRQLITLPFAFSLSR